MDSEAFHSLLARVRAGETQSVDLICASLSPQVLGLPMDLETKVLIGHPSNRWQICITSCDLRKKRKSLPGISVGRDFLCSLGEKGMSTTRNQRTFWVGDHFATYCFLQSGVLVSFASLYMAPTPRGCILKERHWENGVLLTTKELAVRRFYLEAGQLFYEALDDFNQRMFRQYAPRKNRTMRFTMQSRTPLKWRAPTLGATVTCLRPREAYYTGYAGNPPCFFEPGDIGIVGAVDVPAVFHNPENRSDLFACVDFEKPEYPTPGQHNTTRWRCSMYYHQMIQLSHYLGQEKSA